MPRAITSRSILANRISTWLSQEEYVGGEVKLDSWMLLQELADRLSFVS